MLTILLIIVLLGFIRFSWWAFRGLTKIMWIFICLAGYVLIGVFAIKVFAIVFAAPLIGLAFLITCGRLLKR